MQGFIEAIRLTLFIATVFFLWGCERKSPPEVKKVKVGEVELAYYTRGSGEPLVMIMGFRGTMALWDPALLDALEKKFQLILFDNRGVGFSSDTEDNSTTIEQMAEDTVGLIKALNIQKTHILGWSMGSYIAMMLAIKNREMVDHLILCSPNPGGKYHASKDADSNKKIIPSTLTPEEARAVLFPSSTEGREAARSYKMRLDKAIGFGSIPNDLEVKERTIERQEKALQLFGKDERIFEKLHEIDAPTLVAGGVDDSITSPENVRIVANEIPNAWTAFFWKAGHNFLSQDHDPFQRLVILFTETLK